MHLTPEPLFGIPESVFDFASEKVEELVGSGLLIGVAWISVGMAQLLADIL